MRNDDDDLELEDDDGLTDDDDDLFTDGSSAGDGVPDDDLADDADWA